MKRTDLAAIVTTLIAASSSTYANSAPPTDPVFSAGLIGSYSELEFKGRRSTDTDHIPEGGLFLNFGNKMSAQAGLIYHAEITGQYAKSQGEEIKDAQADLDLGWRVALDSSNFLDALIGAGYKWNRFYPDFNKFDVDLTSRTPFVKAAAGYNHQFDAVTLRLEAGVRRTVSGDTELNINGISSEELDLKDTNNPYVELHFLVNPNGAFPVIATLYYSRFKYDVDGQFARTDFDKQTRDEYGLKLGLVF